jgi:hypothetical protein
LGGGGGYAELKIEALFAFKVEGALQKILSKPTNNVMHIICCSHV